MSTDFNRSEFLEAVFGPYFMRHKGFILVKTAKVGDPRISVRYFPRVDILAKEQYGRDENVFFGVCPRESMKPGQESIRFVAALWAGLDLGADRYSGKDGHYQGPAQAAKAVRSFPLAPSIVVESGLGLHLYWLLDEVAEIATANGLPGLLQKISGYFLCKAPVRWDAALRLPGTFNPRKASQPVQCGVKFINPSLRYSLADFLRLETELPEPVVPAADKMAGDQSSARVQEPPGPEKLAPMRPRLQVPEPQTVFTSAPPSSEPTSSAVTLTHANVEAFAEHVANKIMEKIGDKLADRIVEGLYRKLGPSSKK
ncbi:MAG: hypothetical protein AB1646_25145 [Thermodesulfobacteriota bacterium]